MSEAEFDILGDDADESPVHICGDPNSPCDGLCMENYYRSIKEHTMSKYQGVPEMPLRDGEPCSHRGCLHHLTHPCEGCGRIAGKAVKPEAGPPDKIYLQWHGSGDPDDVAPVARSEVTWCEDKVFPGDVPYVRDDLRDAVLEALGDCQDPVQRVEDLNRVNDGVWEAKTKLRRFEEITAEIGLPEFYVSELRRTMDSILDVRILEEKRRNNKELETMDVHSNLVNPDSRPTKVRHRAWWQWLERLPSDLFTAENSGRKLGIHAPGKVVDYSGENANPVRILVPGWFVRGYTFNPPFRTSYPHVAILYEDKDTGETAWFHHLVEE